jgi:hypothetical protein
MIDGIPLWFWLTALLLTAATVVRAWWLDRHASNTDNQ